MEKIIKKADIYLKLDNDSVCYTIEIPETWNPTRDMNFIIIKLGQLLNLHDMNKIKLESIYFREEKNK